MRAAVGVLVLIGVASALGRAVYVADLGHRMEPVRERTMAALGLPDPDRATRAAEMERFDRNFAGHPGVARGHVLPGALFLALAPLQFWGRLRTRHPRVHRWTGRVLLLAALVSTGSALFFGLRTPFGGVAETIPISLAAVLFLFALARATVAIRARDVARHREWMIRAFALAVGIATVRVVGLVLDLTLTPLGVPLMTGFVMALWVGWVVSVATAEAWIRHTRGPAPMAVAARAAAA
jgi:uncharacterized membrane protein